MILMIIAHGDMIIETRWFNKYLVQNVDCKPSKGWQIFNATGKIDSCFPQNH